MNRFIAAFALGAGLLLTVPSAVRAQGKQFGTAGSLAGTVTEEISIAYFCIFFASQGADSADLNTALALIVQAFNDYQKGGVSTVTVTSGGFGFGGGMGGGGGGGFGFGRTTITTTTNNIANAQNELLQAALIVFNAHEGSAGSPIVFTPGGQGLIDQGAFGLALQNVATVPGWAADPGNSDQLAWWGLWFILYAMQDM